MAKRKVRRPTEEKAFSAIARQAAKLNITQFELLTRNRYNRYKRKNRKSIVSSEVCTCPYCSRKRKMDISHRVVLNPA